MSLARPCPRLACLGGALRESLGFPVWDNPLTLGRSWPADRLFERVTERIKRQIEKVEDMTGDMDPKTNFALIVIQTELERYKFLVRSYLRVRIAKVCKLEGAKGQTSKDGD